MQTAPLDPAVDAALTRLTQGIFNLVVAAEQRKMRARAAELAASVPVSERPQPHEGSRTPQAAPEEEGPMSTPERADELMTLRAAAALAGLGADVLRVAARQGRLVAVQPGNEWLTTRRDLHRYLTARRRGVVKPLPPSYVAPEPEEVGP